MVTSAPLRHVRFTTEKEMLGMAAVASIASLWSEDWLHENCCSVRFVEGGVNCRSTRPTETLLATPPPPCAVLSNTSFAFNSAVILTVSRDATERTFAKSLTSTIENTVES
jgi:hypothetical protein